MKWNICVYVLMMVNEQIYMPKLDNMIWLSYCKMNE